MIKIVDRKDLSYEQVKCWLTDYITKQIGNLRCMLDWLNENDLKDATWMFEDYVKFYHKLIEINLCKCNDIEKNRKEK